MAVYKRGGTWWYSFIYAGKRIQESAKTSRKTVALEAERARRLELEKTLAGMPIEKRENRIKSVAEMVKAYEVRYAIDHRDREQSILFFQGTPGSREAAPRNPAFARCNGGCRPRLHQNAP